MKTYIGRRIKQGKRMDDFVVVEANTTYEAGRLCADRFAEAGFPGVDPMTIDIEEAELPSESVKSKDGHSHESHVGSFNADFADKSADELRIKALEYQAELIDPGSPQKKLRPFLNGFGIMPKKTAGILKPPLKIINQFQNKSWKI